MKIFSHTPLNISIQNDVAIFNNVFRSAVKNKQNYLAKLEFCKETRSTTETQHLL